MIDRKGTLVGVLTERDLLEAALQAIYHDECCGRVGDHMSHDVQVVRADDALIDVAARFAEGKYRRLPVIEDNRVVGLVTRRDVLRVMLDAVT